MGIDPICENFNSF